MYDKIINNVDNFKITCLSYSKISAILCVLYFIFLHFILFNLVIFDTCDVMYNWSISLMPPIVLDNLFGQRRFQGGGGYLAQLAPPPLMKFMVFRIFLGPNLERKKNKPGQDKFLNTPLNIEIIKNKFLTSIPLLKIPACTN